MLLHLCWLSLCLRFNYYYCYVWLFSNTISARTLVLCKSDSNIYSTHYTQKKKKIMMNFNRAVCICVLMKSNGSNLKLHQKAMLLVASSTWKWSFIRDAIRFLSFYWELEFINRSGVTTVRNLLYVCTCMCIACVWVICYHFISFHFFFLSCDAKWNGMRQNEWHFICNWNVPKQQDVSISLTIWCRYLLPFMIVWILRFWHDWKFVPLESRKWIENSLEQFIFFSLTTRMSIKW